jgi:hypothetical protein
MMYFADFIIAHAICSKKKVSITHLSHPTFNWVVIHALQVHNFKAHWWDLHVVHLL